MSLFKVAAKFFTAKTAKNGAIPPQLINRHQYSFGNFLHQHQTGYAPAVSPQPSQSQLQSNAYRYAAPANAYGYGGFYIKKIPPLGYPLENPARYAPAVSPQQIQSNPYQGYQDLSLMYLQQQMQAQWSQNKNSQIAVNRPSKIRVVRPMHPTAAVRSPQVAPADPTLTGSQQNQIPSTIKAVRPMHPTAAVRSPQVAPADPTLTGSQQNLAQTSGSSTKQSQGQRLVKQKDNPSDDSLYNAIKNNELDKVKEIIGNLNKDDLTTALKRKCGKYTIIEVATDPDKIEIFRELFIQLDGKCGKDKQAITEVVNAPNSYNLTALDSITLSMLTGKNDNTEEIKNTLTHYGAKHAKGLGGNERSLIEILSLDIEEQNLTCAASHKITSQKTQNPLVRSNASSILSQTETQTAASPQLTAHLHKNHIIKNRYEGRHGANWTQKINRQNEANFVIGFCV